MNPVYRRRETFRAIKLIKDDPFVLFLKSLYQNKWLEITKEYEWVVAYPDSKFEFLDDTTFKARYENIFNHTVFYQGKERSVIHKFNITLKELESAVQYAKEHGKSEHKTITIAKDGGEVGGCLFISSGYHDEAEDISDYDSV